MSLQHRIANTNNLIKIRDYRSNKIPNFLLPLNIHIYILKMNVSYYSLNTLGKYLNILI